MKKKKTKIYQGLCQFFHQILVISGLFSSDHGAWGPNAHLTIQGLQIDTILTDTEPPRRIKTLPGLRFCLASYFYQKQNHLI
jgi:hypothetical protein